MGKKKAYMKTAHLFSGENNQFRMKFNRNKHSVLNASVKGTKGHPIMSKSIAYAKRKAQWEKSQVLSKKANRFIDKRLIDPSMSFEDQATARFIRERQKMGKKNKFNLNDEEELTHKGKPVQDINDMENLSGSEDEAGLDANFVSKAHFGGFLSESNFETAKSHKEVIEQLINESKQKKHEKKVEKELYVNSQEMVDKEWKEIHLLSASMPKSSSIFNRKIPEPTITKETKDIYDISKLELKFEPKASSIAHTKSPEELARIEEENRIQREKERLARMFDPSEIRASTNHESADALCDEYDYLQPLAIDDNDSHVEDSEQEVEEEMQEEEKEETLPDDQETNFNCDIPQDIESLTQRIENNSSDKIYDVIDDILKTTIRSKKEKVKSKLVNFFDVLLQYCLNCCESEKDIKKTGMIIPHLHSLAQVDTSRTAQKFLEKMDAERLLFLESKKHWKKSKIDYPRKQALTILKIAGLIYSVSDRIHPVGTTAMDWMSDILTSKCMNTYSNLVSRLVVTNMWLNDYIKDSKRFVPEIINFLDYILKLAIPVKSKNEDVNIKFNLLINEDFYNEEIPQLNIFLQKKLMSAEDKVAIISKTMEQLNQISVLYQDILSYKFFFEPTVVYCAQLPIEQYPTEVQDSISSFVKTVQGKKIAFCHLKFPNSKPKSLKMFEPSFESKFCKKDDINKKRKLLKKVSQKIRKEERSMMREIRQDAEMVRAEKLKKILEADAERKRKVKEIYAELANQEGEYKKMMKKK